MVWDYIIVGAGSAGCVLANRLTADGTKKILLLEAGGTDRNPLNRIPAAGTFLNIGTKADWNYQTAADPSREGKEEIWPRGKILGGSSSINGMIYARGHADDYNGWETLGNKGWGYQSLLPYFKQIEDHELEDQEYYGQGGELKIKMMKGAHPLSQTFIDACTELGIPHNPNYNGAKQEGASLLSLTQSKRVRHSSSQAFLMPALKRSNLKVMKNALVTKILLDGKTVKGVEISQKGRLFTEHTNGEVILCGGVINSPQLLMLSGIGPSAHLKEKGINVNVDLPGVGQNLHEHPSLTLQARVSKPTVNMDVNISSALRHGFNWLFLGKGPLTSVAFQALCFAKTTQNLTYPDIQIHFAPMGYIGSEDGVKLLDYPVITLQPNVNRTRSRGYLELASSDYRTAPYIQPNMLGDEYDVQTLVSAGKMCRKLFESDAFNPYFIEEILPGKDVQSDQEWLDYIKRNAGPTYHPVGTCKMGIDNMSVVDPELKVIGVNNLRIADASIIPSIPSGNTNAICMVIGAKAADLIIGLG